MSCSPRWTGCLAGRCVTWAEAGFSRSGQRTLSSRWPSERKLSIVSSRTPASRGFGMNAAALSGSRENLLAEMTITGKRARLGTARSSFWNCHPSITGFIRSSRMSCGSSCSCSLTSACCPLAAVSTRYPSSSSSSLSESRMSPSSSTTRILHRRLSLILTTPNDEAIFAAAARLHTSHPGAMLLAQRSPTTAQSGTEETTRLRLPVDSGRQLDWADVPDLVRVLPDGSIGGELAHPRNVEDCLFGPTVPVEVGARDLLLRAGIGSKVRQAEVGIFVEQRVDQRLEEAGILGRKESGGDQVEGLLQQRFGFVDLAGPIPGASTQLDLLGIEAEEKEVLVPHRISNLDVRAVQCSDGERSVEGELHIPGAGRFLARGRDLLRDVRRREDALGQRDAVVGQEDRLDAGIFRFSIHHLSDPVDQSNDQLSVVVAGRGLAAEDECARVNDRGRLLLGADPERDDVDGVEQLALVLVKALDLHVEDGVRF